MPNQSDGVTTQSSSRSYLAFREPGQLPKHLSIRRYCSVLIYPALELAFMIHRTLF